ncbi:39S ribosomal protein S18a, mitochondrial-like [Dreissena polymorpha]|uniref:39S ribosomal protein S18a, mitochondrial-like n=1 Tax=Dreissena polymorpha TaxID=45954 RepID=UPI002263B889|nr:39S ribosomal protein S18a, mitochondrial-like [Dreissena polymorpha]
MSGTLRFISNFHKLSFQLLRNRECVGHNILRTFKTTPACQLREVIETTKGNVTTVEGRVFDSDRKDRLLKLPDTEEKCVLCKLNIDLKYTDVLILQQFVQEDGQVVPRQITGLCFHQHAKVKKLVHQAHSAGLMQNLRPHVYPKEYSQMSDYKWKKFNVYYNDAVEDGSAR